MTKQSNKKNTQTKKYTIKQNNRIKKTKTI